MAKKLLGSSPTTKKPFLGQIKFFEEQDFGAFHFFLKIF